MSTAANPDDDYLQSLVGPQFQALATALEAQPPAAADAPSLCEGWAVRDVVAHMTTAARYDQARFQTELAAASFDFTTLSNTLARRDGDLPFDTLLDDLRSETMATWAPPGGGASGALSHVVIHGLDATTPLGLTRTATDEAAALVLEVLTTGGVHHHFGTTVEGFTIHATDLDWSYGEGGHPIKASSGDLILALSGRRVEGIDLHGR